MAQQTGNVVRFYGQKGPYAFLSNFYPVDLKFNGGDGRVWPSVEHYYQAMKTLDPNHQEDIRLGYPLGYTAAQDAEKREPNLKPGEAKKKGQKVEKRKDWPSVKELFMMEALQVKFTVPELRQKLLDTGTAELIEDSPTDEYWGLAGGRGQNRLGVLLMMVRDQIRHMCPEIQQRYVPPKRVITMVMEIEDERLSGEIYRAMRNGTTVSGCRITAIADGDVVKRFEDLQSGL